MIAPDRIQPQPLPQQMPNVSSLKRARKRLSSTFLWLCLLLTCTGTSWFACQYFLVPQAKSYAPHWQDAQWIQAGDTPATTNTPSPVAYFRYTMDFAAVPDDAFITIAANQVFQLYVNGNYIGNNTKNFVQGDASAVYMFDIDSLLTAGSNSIGIRIANVDQNMPQMRANIGTIWGQQTRYYGSGNTWQATGQTALAHPRNAVNANTWSTPDFDASQWQSAGIVKQPIQTASLAVNPLVYEQPQPSHWISTQAGQEGYFVRHILLPQGTSEALLRLVATGTAEVFINGHLYIKWNGQVDVPLETINTLLDDNKEAAPYRNGLLLGVYDISPYVHTGSNTIAIHVLSPGTSTTKVGLETLKSALSVDMIVGVAGNYTNPLASDTGWHASSQPVANWTDAQSTAFQWAAPDLVGRPGASNTYYLPDSNSTRSVQILPPGSLAETIFYSILAVLTCWLFIGWFVLRRFYTSFRLALEGACLVFLPALALEALLISLAREPLLIRPFPYTSFWAGILVLVVAFSTLGLWFSFYKRNKWQETKEENIDFEQLQAELTEGIQAAAHDTRKERLMHWLKQNWGLVPIVLLAIPMACYNLAYEPFWQDELSSYYAARNIMQHGFPAFPSGYLYPKGELFSYILALVMSIFGTSSAIVPRTISVVWYLLSILLLYFCGQKFFNRKIAWLATAMLAFSPYTLLWARQTRMYEQAQLSALIVFFMSYRAIQMRDRKRPVYLAMLCLLLAYFSHEENFIILPAVLICVLLGSREGPYRLPAVLRKKHWWSAALIAIVAIITQLLLVFWANPQIFATDQSRRPQIQVSLDNIPYYFNLLFRGGNTLTDNVAPWVLTQPWITVNSLLALLGCLLAFTQKDRRSRYCALFLVISSCTLFFVFTMQADRYYYPLLPIYYLLGAYAFWHVLEATWRFARPHLALPAGRPVAYPQLTLPLRLIVRSTIALLCISVLILPMLPISNYNLFISRISGLPYRHHFADYNDVSQYMQEHLHKGDVVITVAPAVSVLYYVGHVDYYFSIDRSLFLFEQNGKLIETTSGASPLLNQSEFQNVLSAHNRIWLITDNGGYQGGVTKNSRFTFPPSDFRRVYEGYGSAVYFRSAND